MLQLVNKALTGDHKSLETILKYYPNIYLKEDEEIPIETSEEKEARQLVKGIIKQILDDRHYNSEL